MSVGHKMSDRKKRKIVSNQNIITDKFKKFSKQINRKHFNRGVFNYFLILIIAEAFEIFTSGDHCMLCSRPIHKNSKTRKV